MISLVNANSLHIPLADKSVQCVITSPPYWGLRDYGTAEWIGGDLECDHVISYNLKRDSSGGVGGGRLYGTRGEQPSSNSSIIRYRDECGKCGAIRQDRQLGLEATPEEYVANMVAVFREVWRVLRDDGTVWLNLGDSYASAWACNRRSTIGAGAPSLDERMVKTGNGLKEKDLVGIPWRVAFALQADGWYLRSDTIEKVELYCPCGCGYVLEEKIWRYSQDRDIIWAKPNPMPESVTDRPTKSHEYVFMLTKSQRYYYDADAVREENVTKPAPQVTGNGKPKNIVGNMSERGVTRTTEGLSLKTAAEKYNPAGRNRRTVWTIATQPYSGAHFATFPEALVEPCIKAGSSERGCCPECGKAWVRVVEKTASPHDAETESDYLPGSAANRLALARQSARNNGGEYSQTVNTLGWKPACTHDHAPIPCTVFDPFAGTATVGVVANRYGRSFVGLDLSLDYIHLAVERIKKSNGYHVGRLL